MGRKTGDVLLSHKLDMHYHRGCSVSLPCSEWERVGPLRWDHQNSDEFEATFQALWEGSHWGDESDLKFARVLATRRAGLLGAFTPQTLGLAGGPHSARMPGAGHLGLSKNTADSLTSTYRSKYKISKLRF